MKHLRAVLSLFRKTVAWLPPEVYLLELVGHRNNARQVKSANRKVVASVAYLVYVTVPDKDRAMAVARMLVASGHAAGVNVLPGALSVYRWQDEIREAGECLLFAQVSQAAFPDFCKILRQHHCYEVPCIVALSIETGHVPFMRWIEENSVPK